MNKLAVVGKRDLIQKNILKAFNFKLGTLDNKNEKIFLDTLKPNTDHNLIDEGDKLISIIDIFFVFLFLILIYLLSIQLGIISSLFIIVYLILIKFKKYVLKSVTISRNKKV